MGPIAHIAVGAFKCSGIRIRAEVGGSRMAAVTNVIRATIVESIC